MSQKQPFDEATIKVTEDIFEEVCKALGLEANTKDVLDEVRQQPKSRSTGPIINKDEF